MPGEYSKHISPGMSVPSSMGKDHGKSFQTVGSFLPKDLAGTPRVVTGRDALSRWGPATHERGPRRRGWGVRERAHSVLAALPLDGPPREDKGGAQQRQAPPQACLWHASTGSSELSLRLQPAACSCAAEGVSWAIMPCHVHRLSRCHTVGDGAPPVRQAPSNQALRLHWQHHGTIHSKSHAAPLEREQCASMAAGSALHADSVA